MQQEWLRLRLDRAVPRLLREHGVNMWLVPVREHNEAPVFRALVSPTTMSARRRTICVFLDRGDGLPVERLVIGGRSQGGLDSSHAHTLSDGLSAGEWEQLQQGLGPRNLARVVRAQLLPLPHLEESLPELLPAHRRVAGPGDVPLCPNPRFAVELQATSPVAEWNGQPVRVALEEDAYLDAQGRFTGCCSARRRSISCASRRPAGGRSAPAPASSPDAGARSGPGRRGPRGG